MRLTRTGRSPTTKCTTTSWTASGTRGRTRSRSTPSLERCSPSWCSTGRRREHSLSRSRPEMGLPPRGRTTVADQTQVGDFLFYKMRLGMCWMFDALETRGLKKQIHETFHRSEASLQNFSLTYHGISRPFYFMKLELHFIPCSRGLFC